MTNTNQMTRSQGETSSNLTKTLQRHVGAPGGRIVIVTAAAVSWLALFGCPPGFAECCEPQGVDPLQFEAELESRISSLTPSWKSPWRAAGTAKKWESYGAALDLVSQLDDAPATDDPDARDLAEAFLESGRPDSAWATADPTPWTIELLAQLAHGAASAHKSSPFGTGPATLGKKVYQCVALSEICTAEAARLTLLGEHASAAAILFDVAQLGFDLLETGSSQAAAVGLYVLGMKPVLALKRSGRWPGDFSSLASPVDQICQLTLQRLEGKGLGTERVVLALLRSRTQPALLEALLPLGFGGGELAAMGPEREQQLLGESEAFLRRWWKADSAQGAASVRAAREILDQEKANLTRPFYAVLAEQQRGAEAARHETRAWALALVVSHRVEKDRVLGTWEQAGFSVSIAKDQGGLVITVSDSKSDSPPGIDGVVLRIP